MKHALASPSNSAMWLACANSLAANIGQCEESTAAADLGTDKHELMTICLGWGKDPITRGNLFLEPANASFYLGRTMGEGNIVTEEFANDVQMVVDSVRIRISSYELLGHTVEMLLDSRVPIESITGESGASGTLDAALLVHRGDATCFIDIIDAKFGFVPVEADNNSQLTMYAYGALEELDLAYEFDQVNLVIEQPSRGTAEYGTTPSSVKEWSENTASPAARKAIRIYEQKIASPGVELRIGDYGVTEKGCRWCGAKTACPAYQAEIERLVGLEFAVVNPLADKFLKIGLVKEWVKAIENKVYSEMISGNPITGLKLVRGRKGNRAWKTDAEDELRNLFCKERLYEAKLKTPTQMLEIAKKDNVEDAVLGLLTRSEGALVVVEESDKRPAAAARSLEDGFEAID